jgi:hypothetical protein
MKVGMASSRCCICKGGPRTATSDPILAGLAVLPCEFVHTRNQRSSKPDKRRRQSASKIVATVLTMITLTVAMFSGVAFISSFAGPYGEAMTTTR